MQIGEVVTLGFVSDLLVIGKARNPTTRQMVYTLRSQTKARLYRFSAWQGLKRIGA